MNLIQLADLTEDQAREYLESIRWPNGPVCPHCESRESTKLQGKATRPGVYKCRAKECRKQFTVTVGTIFHRTRVTIKQWIMAFHLVCSSKKGFSAHQLHRELGVTYKTAWFMAHRIRECMISEPSKMLTGTVEVDETYVGGKPRYKDQSKPGRGTKKSPVVALVERGGNARMMVVENVRSKTLKGAIRENVDNHATIMTDEWKSYIGLEKEFTGGHQVVRHGVHEYVRGDANTNTAESAFALIKRGHYGIFHHYSKRHLPRYITEHEFRWNHRKVSDGERTIAAIRGAEGKRLTYREPMGRN